MFQCIIWCIRNGRKIISVHCATRVWYVKISYFIIHHIQTIYKNQNFNKCIAKHQKGGNEYMLLESPLYVSYMDSFIKS